MVFPFFSASMHVAEAKKGNTAIAIRLLTHLNQSLKGESELEEATKEYFIECLNHLLSNINDDLTDHQVQTLTALSFNLVRKKGRKEPSRTFVENITSVVIHNLKVENPHLNIDDVVMLFMSTREKYARQYKEGKTDSLVKKYRFHKKKYGWDNSQIITLNGPE